VQKQIIRVLIVDDNANVRHSLRIFFDAWDEFEVVGEAETGREAVELCGLLEPDVVLMDLIMPEMNGIEASRRISKAFPHIRIVILTNTLEHELIEAAEAAGISEHLPKTVSVDALAETIKNVAT
jgi:two-component system, NarL family, response regulator LiaR